MDFYRKIIVATFLGTFLPILALAQSHDFLHITGTLSNGEITIENIEQRVFDQGNIEIFKSGSYEARILKGKKKVSGNFFEVIANPEFRVEIEGKPEKITVGDKSSFGVKLPLTENLDVANSIIEIWRGSDLLLSKKLVELPVEVLKAESYAVIDQRNHPSLSYLFHLYYNGQLFADRDFEFKYDVIPEEYKPEALNTDFPYRGEITNFLGQIKAEFLFDPGSYGNGPLEKKLFVKGKISVKAPYIPDGQKAVFYDSQDNLLVTIFVSESSFCNDDKVCDTEKGENSETCPDDCDAVVGGPIDPGTGGEGEENKRSSPLILWSLLIVLCGAGGWYGWKWWEKRKDQPTSPLLPPAITGSP